VVADPTAAGRRGLVDLGQGHADPDARIHPVLVDAWQAAATRWASAVEGFGRQELIEAVGDGADGTPSSRLDELVEAAILDAVDRHSVNVLSEEAGWIDRGSSLSLVIDPIDGTGNAAAGVPFAAFTAALAADEQFIEGLTVWLDTGRYWWADRTGQTRGLRPGRGLGTTGRSTVDGAIVSMIRPKADPGGFLAVARQADRTRILGSSSIEAALVADGRLDAALDPGSRTHRIVDLAAAAVLVPAAGGVVVDLHGRPVEFTTDITGRWSGICAATQPLADELAALCLQANNS
jgi:myo-inositol-1(or 4)-monophosphatase